MITGISLILIGVYTTILPAAISNTLIAFGVICLCNAIIRLFYIGGKNK